MGMCLSQQHNGPGPDYGHRHMSKARFLISGLYIRANVRSCFAAQAPGSAMKRGTGRGAA